MAFNGYVQIPPDSTGKKVSHGILVELDYENGTIDFELNDVVVGQTSGITGVVVRVDGTTSSGELYLHLDRESPVQATVGENLRVGGVTRATAANTGATNTIYIPSVSIADHENSFNGQRVNNKGAASVTFAEGEPTMDAFGNLRIAQAHALAVYEHTQRNYDDLFNNFTRGNGTCTHITSSAYYELAVDNTSGSVAARTTNRYHYYLPGTGLMTIITLGLSDTGKVGNVRRWGYFDNSNGMYFELSGSDLNVCVRRGGVDIARVPQADWNGDQLDGTGLSTIDLDVTKANFYWIDMAWLGVGEVRFGVLKANGERIVAHTYETANIGIDPYTYSPHLPIRIVNANLNSTVGSSEIRLICSAVYSDSIAKEDYTFWRNSDVETTASGQTVTDRTPFLSLRNQSTNILGSGTNRVSIYPETLALYVADNPVKIEVFHDVELTGSSGWITSSVSTIAYDNSATTMSLGSGGFKFITFYAPVGVTNVDLRQYYELNDEALCLRADGDYRTYTYTATPLAGSSSRITATMTYRELS